jgi:hypothetical protein
MRSVETDKPTKLTEVANRIVSVSWIRSHYTGNSRKTEKRREEKRREEKKRKEKARKRTTTTAAIYVADKKAIRPTHWRNPPR